MFDTESVEERSGRLVLAEAILVESGGTYTQERHVTDKGVEIVVYDASIPEDQANKHHGFDSKLNKSWPDGCGAGWVEERITNTH